jgi:hypothetical protein
MASLKLYYSSGSASSQTFTGEARKSIGGIITDVALPNGGMNSLFGDVSLRMLSEKVSDYRGVFLKNIHPTQNITLLNVYADVPLLAGTLDPATLTPVTGDKYVVPTGAVGAWLGKDGKKAVWNGTAWVFSFAPFTSWEFGFSAAGNTTIVEGDDDVIITNGYVRPLENIFEAPLGVDFYDANGSGDALQIGSGVLNAGQKVFMWMRRAVVQGVNDNDLVTDEGTIITQEDIPVVFNYDIA